jgi:hypothetical protein
MNRIFRMRMQVLMSFLSNEQDNWNDTAMVTGHLEEMRVQRFLDFFYNEQDLSLGKYTKYFNDQ